MTKEELLMLKCMVEYIEVISGNDYVYGSETPDMVSLEACRRWLESEMYKREKACRIEDAPWQRWTVEDDGQEGENND